MGRLYGFLVKQIKARGATKTGAGEARTYDAAKVADFVNRFDYTFASAVSYKGLGEEPRAQVAASPTGVGHTTGLALGVTHANLANPEVKSLSDDVEAAPGQRRSAEPEADAHLHRRLDGHVDAVVQRLATTAS